MKQMTLPVVVADSDIDNGERQSYSSCPIALAVKRAAKGQGIEVENVMVDGYRIEFEDNEARTWEAKCTGSMRQFVLEFDQGAEVSPFEISLEFIDEEMAELLAEPDDDEIDSNST